MSRTTTMGGAVAALALLAAVQAPTAMAAPAPAPATQTDVWADFQTPAAWDNQADNLHWYVATPVITRAMTGKSATLQVTSPATLDCGSLVGGYGTATGWVDVPVTVTSCSATTATVTYRLAKQMVGQRVSVIGWSATSLSTAQVTGRVTIGRTTSSQRVTAHRTDAVQPVGALQPLGNLDGKAVSIASGGGVNEVWVGGTRYSAPDGQVAHVSLDGSVVNLWIHNATSMDQWKLDLTTGKATTQSIPMASLVSQGKPGFTVDTGVAVTYGTKTIAYRWDGTVALTTGSFGETVIGYTDTAFVTSGGYRVWHLAVTDTDGTQWGSTVVPTMGMSPTAVRILPDRVEVDYPASNGTPAKRCTITKQLGTVCVDI